MLVLVVFTAENVGTQHMFITIMLWLKQTKSSFQLLKSENITENSAAQDLEEVVWCFLFYHIQPPEQSHAQSNTV